MALKEGYTVLEGVDWENDVDIVTVKMYLASCNKGVPYKLQPAKKWINKCGYCKKTGTLFAHGTGKRKNAPEGEITCKSCDTDYDGVSGKSKEGNCKYSLTIAPNSSKTPSESAKNVESKDKDRILKIDSVLTASSNIKSFVENNGQLPNYVTIENQKYSMNQYLYLSSIIIFGKISGMNKVLLDKDQYCKNTIKQADNPTPQSFKADIDMKTVYGMVSRTSNYITKNEKTPRFISSKYGNIQYQVAIYAYAKILDYYKKNKTMPKYVSLDIDKNSELATYIPKF